MTAKEKQELIDHIMSECSTYVVIRQCKMHGDFFCYSIAHRFLAAGFHFYAEANRLYRFLNGYDYGTMVALNQKQSAALNQWCEANSKAQA